MIEKITNHVEQAQDRLIELYKKPNFKAFTDSFLTQIQDIENETFDVYENRFLFTANGTNLDLLGESLGEFRNGKNDLEYRLAILARVSINIGSGNPDLIINVIRQLYNTNEIVYKEQYPASFGITFGSDIKIPNVSSFINSIKPAGVGNPTLMQYNGIPFVFGTISGEDSVLQISPDDAVENEVYALAVQTEEGIFPLSMTNEYLKECEGGQGFATVLVNRPFLSIEDEGSEALYNLGDDTILSLQLENEDQDYIFSQYGGNLATVI